MGESSLDRVVLEGTGMLRGRRTRETEVCACLGIDQPERTPNEAPCLVAELPERSRCTGRVLNSVSIFR